MADIAETVGCAVRTTHLIDTLPAIPTQDWVNRCAQALTAVAPRAGAACMVCTLEHDSDRVEVISSGVAMGASPGEPRSKSLDQSAITLQDRCERLNRLGFPLPQHAVRRGLISSLRALDSNWNALPLGRLLDGTSLHHPLVHIVPIAGNTKPGGGGLCLMNIVGMLDEVAHAEALRTLHLLRAVHEPLCVRARDALTHVNNPRAWLTDREQGVLDLLIEGHSVREIADRMERSAHTVHDHVKNLHKKIGASSRGELIARAMGHRPDGDREKIPEPVVLTLPPDQFTELKPPAVTAHHLRP